MNKLIPVQAMKAYMDIWDVVPFILNPALDVGVLTASIPCHFTPEESWLSETIYLKFSNLNIFV